MPHLDKFPLLHLVLEYNILRTIVHAKKENGHSSRNVVIQTVVVAKGQNSFYFFHVLSSIISNEEVLNYINSRLSSCTSLEKALDKII